MIKNNSKEFEIGRKEEKKKKRILERKKEDNPSKINIQIMDEENNSKKEVHLEHFVPRGNEKENTNVDLLVQDKTFDSIVYVLNNDCCYLVNSDVMIYGFKESIVRKLTDVNKDTFKLIGILIFWFFFLHCAASSYVISFDIIEDPVRVKAKSWLLLTVCLLFVMISAPFVYRQKYLTGKILSIVSILCTISSIIFVTFNTISEVKGNEVLYIYDWTLFTLITVPNAELYYIISKFIEKKPMSNFIKFIFELIILSALMIPVSFCILYFGLTSYMMFHIVLALVPIIVSVAIIALKCLFM